MVRVIGLTGGIASGKSTVARILRELGAAVVDADELARRVVEPGRPAHAELVREFGPEILAPDGTIDRKKLGAMVFADEARRRRLNAITHPRIGEEARREIADHAARGADVVIYEAALLVENGLHRALDGMIVVAATPEQQRARAMERDGLLAGAADARIAAQLPLADKVAAATHVIQNTGSLAETREQVARLWEQLKTKPS
jgi:dephospho-CoA kinase